MVFRAWISEVDDHVDVKEEAARLTRKTMDEILDCPGWQYSKAVREAERALDQAYHLLVAGKATIDDYRAACERWKAAGMVEEKTETDTASGAIDASCKPAGAGQSGGE